jgi:hypothetical protein
VQGARCKERTGALQHGTAAMMLKDPHAGIKELSGRGGGTRPGLGSSGVRRGGGIVHYGRLCARVLL